ncbi:hypothetical protein EUX98_g9372 [Antrodiella citrinella]|uniref:Cytochrome P450 n=1 Tax=Antrodiella citrinella TaxID=2447956 RepID=A0A4S4LVA0_9APHY|nr:hypothetical protein EUX98_g9372 [Antrodiella citrinella]
MSTSLLPFVSLAVLLGLYLVYKCVAPTSISDIPGPKPDSFWLGNVGKLYRSLIGDVDFVWQDQFGGIARIKGPIGQDVLWISDPKALQFIHQTAGYNFPKPSERQAIIRLSTDHGLASVDGEIHKRQRKVMLPAFGTPETKALLPIFSKCAQSITAKWKDQLFDTSDQTNVYNIPSWLSSATLDAIGEAAFDHQFNSLDNQEDEFIKGYQNMFIETFGGLSESKVFFLGVSRFIPLPLLEMFYAHVPGLGLDPTIKNRKLAHKFAKEMIASKSEAIDVGNGRHDVMSILLTANKAHNTKTGLTDYEMLSQMRTILIAGHETTSNSLSWGLYELARNPEIQQRLRKEIHDAEAGLKARGRSHFTVSDLEAMPFNQACVKEMLRLHPVVPHTFRIAGKNIAVPLSKPITTLSGKVTQEVFIPKGTRITVAIAAYNRDKSLFGEDAHEFNPARWLNMSEKRDTSVGVYSNLLTFSAGVRACIGWRFAVFEMQLFLIELISNFEFSWTEETKKPATLLRPKFDQNFIAFAFHKAAGICRADLLRALPKIVETSNLNSSVIIIQLTPS